MIPNADRERYSKIRALISQGVRVSPDELKWYRESSRRVRGYNQSLLARSAWPKLGNRANPRHVEEVKRSRQCG